MPDDPRSGKDHPAAGRDTGYAGHGGKAADHGAGGPAGHGTQQMAMGLATPWAHFFAAIVLGVWLITSPSSFEYRDAALAASDVISGALIIAFAVVTLVRRSSWAPWANTLVGVWLLFAPLVFEAPTAVAFANDWLAGILVISFVLLMPGMPGMRMLPGPDVPPGWSYNPSTWPQRGIIIALAILNFLLARYMTTYQLGYADSIWDPFFDPGTRAVLTSDVSRAFPISDAGLGAVSYIIEALMGFMGDRARWRTMPWMVSIFGILVVPVGIVSVTLIMLQPVAVGNWCTVCLITALAMLIMVALTLDEVVAMGLFLFHAHREGQSVWRVFWLGGTLRENTDAVSRTRPDVVSAKATVWGVALPWNLLLSAALGLWLLLTPAVFGIEGTAAAHGNHIVGALVVTVAVISLADVGRAARFANVLFGAWFVVAPWLLNGGTTAATLNDVAVGAALILLSFPRGPVGERYGAWERFVR